MTLFIEDGIQVGENTVEATSPVQMPIRMSIETITPEDAKVILELNFERNRQVSKQKVAEYAREMKAGKWDIGADAISFDTNGNLINGQHRLHAVILAEAPQQFPVIRGLPYSASATMDIGRKRTASERQFILGYNCNMQEFACIRNALTPWQDARMGAQFYRDSASLEFCASIFRNHEIIVKEICKKYPRTSGIYKSAAVRMYAQMCSDQADGIGHWNHGMNPETRTIFWLDLVTNGFSEHHPTNPETDNAALIMKRYADNIKMNKVNFGRKDDYRKTCYAAYKFMQGNTLKHLGNILRADPFTSLDQLPATCS